MNVTALTPLATHFAPAGRESAEQLSRARDLVRSLPLFQATIDALPDMMLILNARRQVVGCNQAVCDCLRAEPPEVIGKRPGELFQCIHGNAGPDGCGTSQACSTCGAIQAVLESQRTKTRVTQECRLRQHGWMEGGVLDLQVTAAPLEVEGEQFTICFVANIGHRQRLALLARMFFHDVLNTAGGIRGFAQMLAEKDRTDASTEEGEQHVERLLALSQQLVEEIAVQRDLTLAESGELETRREPVQLGSLLRDLRALYAGHKVARNRRIVVNMDRERTVVTDKTLLSRVVGNLLKNALEATDPGGSVTVHCTGTSTHVRISVHNQAVMPEQVQLQIFQRSFSTKGQSGRGIGTHSAKLLGEHYLGGRVDFTSQAPEGTCFFIELPLGASADPSVQRPAEPKAFTGRVLLVEDGPDNQRLITFLLKKAGLEVDLAENGRVALEQALRDPQDTHPYDVILMDMQMPELDGLEATRRLRRAGWTGPIIALTASAGRAERQRCLAAGCDAHLTKPIDRASLLDALAPYLETTTSQP